MKVIMFADTAVMAMHIVSIKITDLKVTIELSSGTQLWETVHNQEEMEVLLKRFEDGTQP